MSGYLNKRKATVEELARLARESTVAVTKIVVKTVAEAKEFYKSDEWKNCRAAFLENKEHSCNYCNRDLSAPGSPLNVDHIKPLRYYWHLRVDQGNLQILCGPCNKHKGNLAGDDVEEFVNHRTRSEALGANQRRRDYDRKILIEQTMEEHRQLWTDEYYKKRRRKVELEDFIRQRACAYLGPKEQKVMYGIGKKNDA